MNDPFNFVVGANDNTNDIYNQEMVNQTELKHNTRNENTDIQKSSFADPNNKNQSLDHLFKTKYLNGDNNITKKINHITMIRIVLYILLLISILSSPVYSEMFNTLVTVIMIVIVSTSRIRQDPSYYAGFLIIIGASLIVYDLIYIFFHTGTSQIEGLYVHVIYGLNGLGFLFKIGLVISFIIIKVQSENNENKNSSNNNI